MVNLLSKDFWFFDSWGVFVFGFYSAEVWQVVSINNPSSTMVILQGLLLRSRRWVLLGWVMTLSIYCFRTVVFFLYHKGSQVEIVSVRYKVIRVNRRYLQESFKLFCFLIHGLTSSVHTGSETSLYYFIDGSVSGRRVDTPLDLRLYSRVHLSLCWVSDH